MEWIYKNTKICIKEDGKFYFAVNGNNYIEETLDSAKSKIDNLLNHYYKITEADLKHMYTKLNNREQAFIQNLIDELACHDLNAYCELGIHNELRFDISEILK